MKGAVWNANDKARLKGQRWTRAGALEYFKKNKNKPAFYWKSSVLHFFEVRNTFDHLLNAGMHFFTWKGVTGILNTSVQEHDVKISLLYIGGAYLKEWHGKFWKSID